MRELIDTLNNATKAYDLGKPIMEDKQWDDLYFSLEKKEQESGICYPDSPTQRINYEIVSKLNKVTHSHPMLSLSKTKEINSIISIFKDKWTLIMSKLDGLTCSLYYEDGEYNSQPSLSQSLLHIVGRSALGCSVIIPFLINLRQRRLHEGRSASEESSDPHPEYSSRTSAYYRS